MLRVQIGRILQGVASGRRGFCVDAGFDTDCCQVVCDEFAGEESARLGKIAVGVRSYREATDRGPRTG